LLSFSPFFIFVSFSLMNFWIKFSLVELSFFKRKITFFSFYHFFHAQNVAIPYSLLEALTKVLLPEASLLLREMKELRRLCFSQKAFHQ